MEELDLRTQEEQESDIKSKGGVFWFTAIYVIILYVFYHHLLYCMLVILVILGLNKK